jgi:hypothetical protein
MPTWDRIIYDSFVEPIIKPIFKLPLNKILVILMQLLIIVLIFKLFKNKTEGYTIYNDEPRKPNFISKNNSTLKRDMF